ncbi:rhomboid family intramembrane serine protease [Pseudofulvimonas gallinarii]|nr:rhomboid family intramembrane serine protease [Pseudofulvimonas gallinarii]THD12674.1 rhomboid family intramembrane serine protease [Pseudofulvimonas gallinarii]
MDISLTLILIIATAGVSLVAFRDHALLDRLILWPPAVSRGGQYYRLLSYGLVHGDGMHLLFNMVTLYFFGSVMEPVFASRIGDVGYVLFYAGGLLVSILPSYLANRNNPGYRSLGASGAVSAVLFAFILLQPWAMLYVFFIPAPAIVFAVVYVGWSVWAERQARDNINHSAHLWGAAYGIVFMLVMEPRVLLIFWEQLTHPRWAG